MTIRIYLHDNIADVLKCFGHIDDVVNKIIDAGMSGLFDMESLPTCPSGGKTSRYDIRVTNSEFINQRNLRGATSQQLSLRRIIYWFVDNEAWSIIGLEMVSDFVPKAKIQYIERAVKISDELVRLHKEVPDAFKMNVMSAIAHMREVLNGI